MSTRASRSGAGTDDGFTLVEVIVALTIFAIAALSAVPLVLGGLKASARARVETLAKDVTQQRIERMRNLPFHVDRQNGPFVDLLDRYYTNAAGTAVNTGETSCTGLYVASAGGAAGAPTGPAFKTTCTTVTDAPGFSEVIYAQFLLKTATPAAVPASYNSQVVGYDGSPSPLLGITVITSYNRSGQRGTLRTYTEVADIRGNQPLVITQGRAQALSVTSTTVDQSVALTAAAGLVKVDGSLTSGSIASSSTAGSYLEQKGVGAPVTGSALSATAPANPAGSTGSSTQNGTQSGSAVSATYGTWASCGWGWATRTGAADVSATTATGLPIAPSDAAPDATGSTSATTSSGLVQGGSGCGGYAFGFRNWLTTPAYSSALRLAADRPLVSVANANGASDLATGLAVGRAAVSATDASTSGHTSTANTGASTAVVSILPTIDRPGGLVTAKLNSSSLSCTSEAAVVAKYNVTVTYPGGSVTLAYDSTTGVAASALPLATGISFLEGGVTHRLSEYLEWDVSTGAVEGSNGERSIDHVFGLSVPDSVAGNGGFGVELGALSCIAVDNR